MGQKAKSLSALKPVRRSKLRLAAGRAYYTGRRYADWVLGGKKYASQRRNQSLAHRVFEHRTILMRRLRDVDMQLQVNKVTNLRIAAGRLDGIVIRPGETFSYWKTIGRPTRGKGYVDGMVLYYGGFKSGTGGGLCQMSNLIYWMTLHTPLEVTERHRHSYDVFPDSNRTQPFGSGATCSYNYLDLQIHNPTGHDYQLRVCLTDEHLVGEWRCDAPPIHTYEIYEEDHRMTQEYWGGYVRHNAIRRRMLAPGGEVVDDREITQNHALMMYTPFLREGTAESEG
ncbi:VanW family protein [Saccharibacillus sp. CPCC 101409]|uniref:VanW family protein n=1 Tax=Saccharibacillus sp. CPCC 101409 TaxID=3058041 RepID=UPI002673B5D3|nr:VanW family protein [Saccharibacillus sp. CPCC 101409]MDO3411550.1 VanW family protein [Saccharibacillus sp. CPCC 101409]